MFTFQINSCGLKAAFHTGLSGIFTVIIKISEASDYIILFHSYGLSTIAFK